MKTVYLIIGILAVASIIGAFALGLFQISSQTTTSTSGYNYSNGSCFNEGFETYCGPTGTKEYVNWTQVTAYQVEIKVDQIQFSSPNETVIFSPSIQTICTDFQDPSEGAPYFSISSFSIAKNSDIEAGQALLVNWTLLFPNTFAHYPNGTFSRVAYYGFLTDGTNYPCKADVTYWKSIS